MDLLLNLVKLFSSVFDLHAVILVVLETVSLQAPKAGEVHVRMLVAPINPADINQIEGSYAFIPERPFVAGNEGVGEILSIGKGVPSFKPGDRVIPAVAGIGTWRNELVCSADDLILAPSDIPLEAAATVLINPCTAYRMLKDFGDLFPGDCVIQNGANSSVGRAVIQMAAAKGLKTINVVRDRPNFEQLENELFSLGATMVVKSERLPLPEVQNHILDTLGGKPKLALNCVGGTSATDLARTLSHSGVLVTYGGMSKRPLTIPTGLLIFSDIKFAGFWVSAWYKKQKDSFKLGNMDLTDEREKMMEDIFDMIRSNRLTLPPFRKHKLESWQDAIRQSLSPYTGFKELFSLE